MRSELTKKKSSSAAFEDEKEAWAWDPKSTLARRRIKTIRKFKKLTGWEWNIRELSHVLAMPKTFPRATKEWRARLIAKIRLGDLKQLPHLKDEDEPVIRGVVDEAIAWSREVARILAILYETPDLGNKQDPLDELIYIVLSRRTRESAYQEAFNALKKRFRSWCQLLGAEKSEVSRLIRSAGLTTKRTDSLFSILEQIKAQFGKCTLEPLRDWSDEEVLGFLTSLPEIEKKSAYCVMMYSLGRQVFPVDTHVARVLGRLGILGTLGVDLEKKDHKQAQRILEDMVPPDLRYSLHVNLIVHGREVCKSKNPDCENCELSRLCRFNNKQRCAAAAKDKKRFFVDLFCGAGGMSTGFCSSGFAPLVALDSNPAACRTYAINHPDIDRDDVICADIRIEAAEQILARLQGRVPDILIGAPPCQGFSLVGLRSKQALVAREVLGGYRMEADERNHMYQYMIGLAEVIKPRLFLMENVPGMDGKKSGKLSFMKRAERDLRTLGYVTDIWNLDASAYGVPQKRTRKFLIGSIDGVLPAMPEPQHQGARADLYDTDALPPISLEHAIYDLPELAHDDGDVVARRDTSEILKDPRSRFYINNRRFGQIYRDCLLYNHRSRYQNARDLELYSLLDPGENSTHAIERHGRDDLMRYRTDVFDDKYARLRPDQPSKTIVSHLAKDGNGFIHPTEVRSITVREAARIQSFPDDFIFTGSPGDQWVQVGNAVPPVLASAIATSMMHHLDKV